MVRSANPLSDGEISTTAGVAPTAARDNLRAASWILVSGVAATLMVVSIRMLTPEINSPTLAALRTSLGLWVLIPWVLGPWLLARTGPGPDGARARIGAPLRFSRPWLHLLRGVNLGVTLNLGFFAVATLPLATATTFFFLAPIFATALAGPLLGERVGARRWAAVGAGFVGALIILRPSGGEGLALGALAGLASAACFSVSLLLGKILGRADGPRSVLISSTAIGALVAAPIAWPVWSPPETFEQWAWVGALVLTASLRMYADIRAYAVGDAGFLAPFGYLRLIFAGLAGWILFSEQPDLGVVFGAIIIMSATIYIARRERALNRSITAGAP